MCRIYEISPERLLRGKQLLFKLYYLAKESLNFHTTFYLVEVSCSLYPKTSLTSGFWLLLVISLLNVVTRVHGVMVSVGCSVVAELQSNANPTLEQACCEGFLKV